MLNQNVKAITDYLSEHAELLSRLVVYPQTNFPGRTQEQLLSQILRKKFEPQVEAWAEDGRENAKSLDQDLQQLWEWASEWVYKRVVTYVAEESADFYTKEEHSLGIDNVNTGLKDDWDGQDGEDEDGEGQDDRKHDGGSGERMRGVESTGDGSATTGQAGVEPSLIQAKAEVAGGKDADELLRFATMGVS